MLRGRALPSPMTFHALGHNCYRIGATNSEHAAATGRR
jgi:hypothetical protein